MGLFDIFSSNSFMDQIRCDEQNYLIWKWHPKGTIPGKNNRENSIRWGSSLRVKDGEVAVFVYNQQNGMMQDYIVGPYDATLETDNLPVLASIVGLAYGGGTPFQAEVYFINLAQIIQVKFGVPFFDVFDPRFPDFSVPVAVRGTISFQIADYQQFIQLHRLDTFRIEDFQQQIRDTVARYVKDVVGNAPAAHNIPVIQLENRIAQINDVVEYDLGQRLQENFGVLVSGVDIGAIEIDKNCDSYRQLMAITRDLAAATAQAEADVQIQDIKDRQRVTREDWEESLRIQREEAQYAQRKQTESAHFAAYQVEKQTEVGVAGANALGQMGASSGVDLGSGSDFNPVSMMAGMAVGSAVGQNLAGVMNQAMAQHPIVPPVPSVSYHVMLNGQAAGPFDISTLTQMAANGQLTADSLVWKPGMAQWQPAGGMEDLRTLFGQVPPPVPTGK